MKNLKIVIVEDEILIGAILKMDLEIAGYNIFGPVGTGEKAIEICRNEDPDVILMDIRLIGEMDGIEAAQIIGTFSSAKIIFTTGYQDVEVKERAIVLKPAAFLNKPVDTHKIDSIIKGIFNE
jgi:YesN/AraC family two-component response regulator